MEMVCRKSYTSANGRTYSKEDVIQWNDYMKLPEGESECWLPVID